MRVHLAPIDARRIDGDTAQTGRRSLPGDEGGRGAAGKRRLHYAVGAPAAFDREEIDSGIVDRDAARLKAHRNESRQTSSVRTRSCAARAARPVGGHRRNGVVPRRVRAQRRTGVAERIATHAGTVEVAAASVFGNAVTHQAR